MQEYFKSGKPVGVICHGPWTLVEADLVRGRTLTSYPSLRTDIRNAGGDAVDEQVVVDQGLVSSRNPDDLPAFCAKIVEEFAEGPHEVARAAQQPPEHDRPGGRSRSGTDRPSGGGGRSARSDPRRASRTGGRS